MNASRKPTHRRVTRKAAHRRVSIKPYTVDLVATEQGMDLVAKVANPPASDNVTTYTIKLPWNGWVPLLMKQLADVTAHKVPLG